MSDEIRVDQLRAKFFDQSGLPMVILDPGGRIIDWNSAAEQTLGFARDEAIGQSALLVRRPEDVRRLELLLKRTVREKRLADFQTTVTDREGREIPVILVFSPLTDDAGEVIGVGIVLRDQTRRMQLERKLAEQERTATLGRLAGGMSHHINNLLTAVSARVEMALARPTPTSSAEALRLTAENIDRITNITRNLLLFSEIERRPHAMCVPSSVTNECLRHLRSELAGTPIRVEGHVEQTPAVALDPQDFQQIVQNLLRNAREAMANRGRIVVRLSTSGDEVVLEVADDGHGVSAADLRHVFQPFWTSHAGMADAADGALGLGLTVARTLATAADGSVDLVSPAPERIMPPGKRPGALATVRLPVVKPPEADSPGTPATPGGAGGEL